MKICGTVLSGGKSMRMGVNKSLLQLNDKTSIEHVIDELSTCSDELLIVANEEQDYRFLQVPIVKDRSQYRYKGPLAGLEAALYHADADIFLIAACDMPFVQRKVYVHLLHHLESYDAVVPVYDQQLHPLSGVYRKRVLPKIQQQLNNHELRVKSFFDSINVRFVDKFNKLPNRLLRQHFFNMNHPEQYEQAKQLKLE